MRRSKFIYAKLFFLAAVSTGAVAANAPSTVAALQCGPGKEQVKQALAQLPLLKSWDYDYDYYYYYFYKEYDASKQKPFGLKAKKVWTETSDSATYLKVRTTLDSNYETAKKAVLRSFKQASCKSETGTANKRNCYLNIPADATSRLSDLYVTEKSATEVDFYCRYK